MMQSACLDHGARVRVSWVELDCLRPKFLSTPLRAKRRHGRGRCRISLDEDTSRITPRMMKSLPWIGREEVNTSTRERERERYHPRRSIRRAVGAEGRRSPSANMPASTPVTIEATAAQVDNTIALPCFKPRVCLEQPNMKREYILCFRKCLHIQYIRPFLEVGKEVAVRSEINIKQWSCYLANKSRTTAQYADRNTNGKQ